MAGYEAGNGACEAMGALGGPRERCGGKTGEPPQVRGGNGGAPSRLQKFEDLRLSCSAFILGQDLSKARLSCPTFPPKQSLRPLWVLLEERADALEAG